MKLKFKAQPDQINAVASVVDCECQKVAERESDHTSV